LAFERLKAAHARRAKLYLSSGWRFDDAELIVMSPDRGMVTPNSITKRFETFAVRQGFKGLRFHDLRHSYGSLLNAEGVDPRTIADLMGHSTRGFSLERYVHSYDESKAAAARALGATLLSERT
jgi:integrase